ncbi:MAG: inositol phosphorylceramide synthase, partial [Muribaculaceae bacterium]|nr:inositol phosphorylceramide synthase [Muribaculaceae bacterium]
MKLPPLRQAIACLAALGVWLVVTALFVGFRPEHAVLALLLAGMFFLTPPSRRLALALLPFFIFGISYDWMNMVPNYTVNPVDTAGLYNT